ncbi:type IV pilus modification protein PilV [Massilia sp. B-10]|nr:type IV pilus modification protein PilV [Massilia sp. B-10]
MAAQVASQRVRHGSALLSNGVQLASTLADRMRANPAQMQAPDALNPYLQLQYDAAAGPPPATQACFAAQCGSAQLAAFDIGETMLALHIAFPAGGYAFAATAPPAWTGPAAAAPRHRSSSSWAGCAARRTAAGAPRPALAMVVGSAP